MGLSPDAMGAFLDQRSKTHLLAGKPVVVTPQGAPSRVSELNIAGAKCVRLPVKTLDVCGFVDATVEALRWKDVLYVSLLRKLCLSGAEGFE